MLENDKEDDELYIKLIDMGVALFAPYVSLVSQGFLYPKSRTLNALRFLLFKVELDEEDKKLVLGK